jgi:outer membrane protein OmpA-like peptidoglycan-associated protein
MTRCQTAALADRAGSHPATARRTAPALLALTVLAAALSGCADMSARQKGTATGAGIGAIGGAVLASATGGKAGTGAVVGGAIGAVAGNLWSKRMEDKRKAMEAATKGTGIDVVRTADDRLKVNVPADFSFDVGRAEVKPTMSPVLDKLAQGLDANMQLQVIGHTDSSGSDAVNNPLSLQRAEAVREHLTRRGVAVGRIAVEGRGEREPVADNGSAAGRAQNRRVEIYLRDTQPAS